MAIWLYYLVYSLIIPFIMIISGILESKGCMKKINSLLGYRTRRAMRNEETWQFAQNYFGKSMFKFGRVLLIICIVVFLPMLILSTSEDIMSRVCAILTIIGIVLLLCISIATEVALKNNFSVDGIKKE